MYTCPKVCFKMANVSFFLQLQKASADHKVQSGCRLGWPGCRFYVKNLSSRCCFPSFYSERGLNSASWQERSAQRGRVESNTELFYRKNIKCIKYFNVKYK
ncbi:hypothetical protein CEXT_379961 [Caerostris extrusa]|uniref:Uncharacterized protein n=1 Tax=Caerostris extrusa TaxID=172846 RepID=A0AAV4VIQ2_CAEEX|nr:hypothetical protein CEXT_379961 [Caerostris extrusa]